MWWHFLPLAWKDRNRPARSSRWMWYASVPLDTCRFRWSSRWWVPGFACTASTIRWREGCSRRRPFFRRPTKIGTGIVSNRSCPKALARESSGASWCVKFVGRQVESERFSSCSFGAARSKEASPTCGVTAASHGLDRAGESSTALTLGIESAERALGTELMLTSAMKSAIASMEPKSPLVIRVNGKPIARQPSSKCDEGDKAGVLSHYDRGSSARPELRRRLDRSRGLLSPSRRCRVHATTHEARCAGPAHADGHLPLEFRARSSEVVAKLAGRPEPRGIRETISPGERRMGTLLDDGDLLGDGGFTHATRTSPGGSRLRHIHGCPTLGKGRTDRSRPPQTGETSRRGGELRMDRTKGEDLGGGTRGRHYES